MLCQIKNYFNINNPFKKGIWKQYFYGCLASLSIACCGSSYAWVNTVVDLIETSSSPLVVPNGEETVLAFLPDVGGIVSPVVAGRLADSIGRRYLLLVAGVIHAASWAAACLVNLPLMFIIRFVQGLILGTVMATLPMYLTEIAETRTRGGIGVLYALGWNFGLFLEYLVGVYFSYFSLIWFNAALCGVCALLLISAPESPYFLLMKGYRVEALQSLASLRDEETIDKLAGELDEIQNSLDNEEKGSWRSLRGCARALEICFVLGICYYTAGSMSLIVYSDATFGKMIAGGVTSRSFTVIMGAVMVMVPVVTVYLVDRLGRRLILIASFATGAAAVAPSVVFLCLPVAQRSTALAYAAVFGICLYIPILTLGPNSVINLFRAELFPSSARASASGLLAFYNNLLSLVSVAVYRPLQTKGLDLVNFGFYLALTVIGTVYSLIRVPETKGKSFDQIQVLLKKK